MAGLQNGVLVRHATLGLGKVVAVEPSAVHVFFPGGDSRFAAKLRLPAALGAPVAREPCEPGAPEDATARAGARERRTLRMTYLRRARGARP